jgi:hypothetical protein
VRFDGHVGVEHLDPAEAFFAAVAEFGAVADAVRGVAGKTVRVDPVL